MNANSSKGDRPPVRNLHRRIAQTSGQVIRNLRRKDQLAPVPPTPKILLYRDEAIIREIRSRVVARALRDEGILARLKRVVVGQDLLSGGSVFDGLTGVDEFVLKPTVKWNWGAEIGTELELKWLLGKDGNLDNLILSLSSVLPAQSVSEAMRKVKSQRSDTPAPDIIYPGKPISIFGELRRKEDLTSEEVLLHTARSSAQIVLHEKHCLQQAIKFLRRRPLYVLGTVETIEITLRVNAGAILFD